MCNPGEFHQCENCGRTFAVDDVDNAQALCDENVRLKLHVEYLAAGGHPDLADQILAQRDKEQREYGRRYFLDNELMACMLPPRAQTETDHDVLLRIAQWYSVNYF